MQRKSLPERTPILLYLFFLTTLVGCATSMPPKKEELSDISRGKKTLVLLRVTSSIEGKPAETFAGAIVDDNIGIGVGGFETGGRLNRVEPIRFLSDESRREGWLYLLVPPGTLYLTFLPPRRTNLFSYLAMFNRAQLWRVDLSPESKLVYAGTMDIDGEQGFLFFGDGYLKNFTSMEVRDDRKDAQRLATKHFSDLGKVETVLMQRHEGPIILTTPSN